MAHKPVPITPAQLEALFPRRSVVIGEGEHAITVRVQGVCIQDIREFGDAACEAVVRIVQMLGAGQKGKSLSEVAVAAVAPLAMTKLFDLMANCCSHDIRVLPHYALPPIVEAWIEETFGKDCERVDAWGKVWTRILQTMGMNAEDAASLSRSLSSSLASMATPSTLSADGHPAPSTPSPQPVSG